MNNINLTKNIIGNGQMEHTIKYNHIIRFNHWFSAIIIIWASASGIYVAEFSKNFQLNETVSFINVSLTTALIPFFMFRVLYSYFFSTHMSESNYINNKIASFVHNIIYIVVIFVLISGVLMMDRPINVFNVIKIPQVISDPPINHIIEIFHKYACWILTVLIALHIAAVIKHHLSGNPIIKKMI